MMMLWVDMLQTKQILLLLKIILMEEDCQMSGLVEDGDIVTTATNYMTALNLLGAIIVATSISLKVTSIKGTKTSRML